MPDVSQNTRTKPYGKVTLVWDSMANAGFMPWNFGIMGRYN